MRLKSFRAATVAEAMQMVRDHFGDDAVIVSTHRGPGKEGVRVTAAVDDSKMDLDVQDSPGLVASDSIDAVEAISQSLDYHGVPSALTDRLLGIASNLLLEDPASALAVALDAALGFSPLPVEPTRAPLMFVGPPGSGKTVTLVKLAVKGIFARHPVSLITTDMVRAGGVEQLAAFARLLEVDCNTADSPEALQMAVGNCPHGDMVLIDSLATNPFDEAEMNELATWLRYSGAEPILVLSAGLDVLESEEIGKAFRRIGATKMVVTRLDMTRRLGSVLATAHAARLKLSDFTNSSQVTHGLTRASPLTLARLLLPRVAVTDSGTDIPDPEKFGPES